jgi:hypothetical protein
MDKLNPNTEYPIKELADYFGVLHTTLKWACQQYSKTKGKAGMKSRKHGRDWHATPKALVRYFKGTRYEQRTGNSISHADEFVT